MCDILNKVKILKQNYKYKEARDLIKQKLSFDAECLRVLAECYYKDLELHREFSYKKALDILDAIEHDDNPGETLRLKGAIYKRKWEYQANLDDLYQSIEFYKQAYKKYKTKDEGYGAINAAYLYDVLADKIGSSDAKYSEQLKQKAKEIRDDIIETFGTQKNNQWIYHTLAQAYLGIGDAIACKDILEEASKAFEYADWEIFTTCKQLKLLAQLKGITEIEFLLPLIGEQNKHILNLSLDKKGLALSGGGFRASFFHLGTLAKLAECDFLKDIEVISTVSGGSIVGVHYYLKLQKLLQSKKDSQIVQNDYIKLVDELIDEFFEAVQTDIRNSVFYSSPLKTLKYLMPFSGYSRTNRLGELYQERIYKKYKNYMKDLIITPCDWKDKETPFRPRFNNWSRKNKVPIIVVNATNLNSGHNWQFQATKIGEPEYMSDMEIDKNSRFEWVRYDSKGLQKEFKNYPIGQAVACSSAVPILFTPIVLENLYEGYKLSISDGGVYDNQGFSGLLSEECDYIICSDASGQMDNQISSHTSILMTNKRTIDIQMDRAREMIFEDMQNKKNRGIFKGFVFTHLKQGLDSHEIDQANVIQKCDENPDKEFQKLVAGVRTDLDRFSKTEAYALMYNGYELMGGKIGKCGNKSDWVFLSVKDDIEKESKRLMDELDLSKYKFGRRFRKWWRS